MNPEQFILKVFDIRSEADFNHLALEIFHFQYRNNLTYHTFVDGIYPEIGSIDHYSKIPCLPIEFFKTHNITSVDAVPQLVFHSSGTTGQVRSTQRVNSEDLYRKSILKSFSHFYGDPSQYIICGLTPDWKTQNDSSLAYMLNYLIDMSSHPDNGFYLGKEKELLKVLSVNPEAKKIVFGITWALLNFAENYPAQLKNTILIETGGMKGKMKEMTRAEVHKKLTDSFWCPVHSEYSMTELMSQAYLTDKNTFSPPPWLKILIRNINDPLTMVTYGKTGGINIIDLANFHTCSFICTRDLGIIYQSGTFEVLGRFDFSDVRGCNLLASEL